MEPHNDLSNNHHNRRPLPNPSLGHTSTRPYPIFTSSKPLNLGARPFIIQNNISRGPSIRIPPLNVQISQLNSLTHLNSLARPVLEQQAPPIRPQIKCQYCNESFESQEILDEHIGDCDMQKISCERCGDRVPMDVYDVHFEECGGLENRMEAVESRTPRYNRRQAQVMEDDDSEELEEMEEGDMYLPESSLSYEQLLLLDEKVEKKGMTEEQMKEFKVQLYVKSLDGEGSCNICLSEYETAEYTRELSCRHKFHKQCIDKWLSANITCPMCKKYLR